MKTNNNSCKVHHSKGKQYTIFVPSSNKNIGGMVEKLGKRFDCVMTAPQCSHEEQGDRRCGTEITAFRIGSYNDKDQDIFDLNNILEIVNPPDRKSDRPALYNVREDITIYSLECNPDLSN